MCKYSSSDLNSLLVGYGGKLCINKRHKNLLTCIEYRVIAYAVIGKFKFIIAP